MGQDTLFDVRVWTSYRARDGKKRRAQTIMESFDQKALVQACKETRGDGNIGCVIQPHWSMGTRNLVLEARFSDGVRWVLKIYMLATEGSSLESSIPGSTSDQTPDGDEIYETFQREFEAFGSCLLLSSNLFYPDLNSIHTKLPVPAPLFIIRLPSSLGPTACLAMDLVQGVTAAFSSTGNTIKEIRTFNGMPIFLSTGFSRLWQIFRLHLLNPKPLLEGVDVHDWYGRRGNE